MAFEEGKNTLLHHYLTWPWKSNNEDGLKRFLKVHGIFIFASTSQFYKSFFFKLISHAISFLVAYSCIAGSNNNNKKRTS